MEVETRKGSLLALLMLVVISEEKRLHGKKTLKTRFIYF